MASGQQSLECRFESCRAHATQREEAMNITELIAELQKFQDLMGDLPVVIEGEDLPLSVDALYWDEDENGNTVLVIGA